MNILNKARRDKLAEWSFYTLAAAIVMRAVFDSINQIMVEADKLKIKSTVGALSEPNDDLSSMNGEDNERT